MVPSWAPGRDIVSRCFPAQDTEEAMVRAEGVEPSRALRPYGFSCHFGFRRRPVGVRGLDYPFTVRSHSGVRCCPSSLYTFPAGSVPSGLGSGLPFQGSPTLSSSASPVSRASTQVLLKSVASADSATPAWPISAAVHDRATAGNWAGSFSTASRRGLAFLPDGFLVALGLILLIAAVSSRVLMCAA